MIDLIKEIWFRYKARAYLKLVKKCTSLRRKVNEKQRIYKDKHEKYLTLYKEQKDKI